MWLRMRFGDLARSVTPKGRGPLAAVVQFFKRARLADPERACANSAHDEERHCSRAQPFLNLRPAKDVARAHSK